MVNSQGRESLDSERLPCIQPWKGDSAFMLRLV
jgi:hypothetical protein